MKNHCNCVFLFGPTACGKTGVGVAIARAKGGEIISADSRQVYRGLDIGSGKDLGEYSAGGAPGEPPVPYHLIDVADLSDEYNVFAYQQDFYRVFPEIINRRKLPVVVGGTGMYLDSVLRNYDLISAPENAARHAELEAMTLSRLGETLLALRPNLHTREDLRNRERCIRAIEIAEAAKSPDAAEIKKTMTPRPDIRPLVLGTTLPRNVIWTRIETRLRERLSAGMICEVERLHEAGATWERLETLGLEYRFVAEYLQGKIESEEKLFALLNVAIRHFAKRQETWFRGMERKLQKIGVAVHWLPQTESKDERVAAALALIEELVVNS